MWTNSQFTNMWSKRSGKLRKLACTGTGPKSFLPAWLLAHWIARVGCLGTHKENRLLWLSLSCLGITCRHVEEQRVFVGEISLLKSQKFWCLLLKKSWWPIGWGDVPLSGLESATRSLRVWKESLMADFLFSIGWEQSMRHKVSLPPYSKSNTQIRESRHTTLACLILKEDIEWKSAIQINKVTASFRAGAIMVDTALHWKKNRQMMRSEESDKWGIGVVQLYAVNLADSFRRRSYSALVSK